MTTADQADRHAVGMVMTTADPDQADRHAVGMGAYLNFNGMCVQFESSYWITGLLFFLLTACTDRIILLDHGPLVSLFALKSACASLFALKVLAPTQRRACDPCSYKLVRRA